MSLAASLSRLVAPSAYTAAGSLTLTSAGRIAHELYCGAMTNAVPVVLATLLAAAGTPVTLGGLTSNAPAAWKEGPAGGMRFKQFTIPRATGDKDDAELVIFFFGPGQGGGADPNITRWKGMFVPPEGKKIDDVAKVETTTIGGAKTTI